MGGTDLHVAIGTYPRTRMLLERTVVSPSLQLRFADLSTANRAFAPMVRELRYDVSEMAIATFLQARSVGVPIVLLPVILAARFQEGALLCRAVDPIADPAGLKGRRVAVRSYSQTTAMWLRGILLDEFDIAATDIDWLTFEDAHVAGIADPPNASRAPVGLDMLAALSDGTVDAVIVGNDVPNDPSFRTVFPDPRAAANRFWQAHGIVPPNHLLTMRTELAVSRPDVATELVRLFRAAASGVAPDTPDAYPTDRARIERGVELALRYTASQHMLPTPLDAAGVWDNCPDAVWSVS